MMVGDVPKTDESGLKTVRSRLGSLFAKGDRGLSDIGEKPWEAAQCLPSWDASDAARFCSSSSRRQGFRSATLRPFGSPTISYRSSAIAMALSCWPPLRPCLSSMLVDCSSTKPHEMTGRRRYDSFPGSK